MPGANIGGGGPSGGGPFGADFGSSGGEQGLISSSATNTSGQPQGFLQSSAQSAANQAIAQAQNAVVTGEISQTEADGRIASILFASRAPSPMAAFSIAQEGFANAQAIAQAVQSDQDRGFTSSALGSPGGNLGTFGLADAPSAAAPSLSGFAGSESGFAGGAGGGGGKVICTQLNKMGWLSDKLYNANTIYYSHVSLQTMRGYHYWALPVVEQIKKRPWIGRALKPFVVARSKELLHVINPEKYKPNYFGKILNIMINTINWTVGLFVKEEEVYAYVR